MQVPRSPSWDLEPVHLRKDPWIHIFNKLWRWHVSSQKTRLGETLIWAVRSFSYSEKHSDVPKVTQQDANRKQVSNSFPWSIQSFPRVTGVGGGGVAEGKKETHRLKMQLQRVEARNSSWAIIQVPSWEKGYSCGGWLGEGVPQGLPWKGGGGKKGVRLRSREARGKRKKNTRGEKVLQP